MKNQKLVVPDDVESLHVEFRTRIVASQQRATAAVNAELSQLYWFIGDRLSATVLAGERAQYGSQMMRQLGMKLSTEFGRGFDFRNLRRMVQFAQIFSIQEIGATLSRQLSWSHFVVLITVRDDAARQYYVQHCVMEVWSVRELRHQIERKGYERSRIANPGSPPAPAGMPEAIFKDPYFLDFLGLRDGYEEPDLEAAILLQLKSFILELGKGFAFVERQKRMIIDGEDFYLDLLFYHRRLRRLVAIELKLGRFKAAHKGQMELYLKWLDRYERQPGEKAPIGLILCAASSKEQIELLQVQKDGITVAEYWTELPPKEELERRLRAALIDARERLQRRALY